MPSLTLACEPEPPTRAPRLALHRHDEDSPGRAAAERFVAGVFRARYGAELHGFAPTLATLHDDAGAITAAAGWRAAGDGPLFLERYLDAPVDALLGVPRARIVEVGHLAATRAGDGRRLILRLGPLLAAQGFQWVASTLTEELRHLFLRLGIAPLALGTADPALLGDEAARWGRYYAHRPLVLAGALEPALATLARRGTAA